MMMTRMFWLLCVVLVLVIAPSIGQNVCPSGLGWMLYNGKCYKFVGEPKLSYREASTMCQDDGATIISINDVDEHKFIRDWIHKNDARRATWWTSGLTSKTGKIWWQGDGTETTYEGAWKIPAKEYLLDDEVVIYKDVEDQYGWAVGDRNEKLSFICEISLQEVYRISQEPRDFDYGLDVDSAASAPKGPYFLVEPESTIILGSTVLMFFDCVVSGNPEPKYEWLREGPNGMEPLKLGGRFTVTSGRLNIQNPRDSDESTYQCKASNTYGTILSRPATVSFGNLGDFSPVQVGTVSGTEYQGSQLECPVITGSPGIAYQWYKNTAASFIRPESQTHTFISSTGKLFFSELTESDTGIYYCMATLVSLGNSRNYVGSSQTESRTSVGFPLLVQKSGGNEYDPDIQKDFIFVYPPVPKRGTTIKLECFAYGTGPLIYTWSRLKGGFPRKRFLFKSANRIIIIRNVEMADEDVYTCHVRSTKTKNKDVASLDLKIQAEPFFIYPLTNQHIDVGVRLTWHCEALGAPFPVYKWYRDGEEVKNGNDDGIIVTSNTLTIAQLNENHNGMYQCAATNDLGTTFSSGQLRVLRISPSFKKNPMLKSLNAARGGNMTIQCNPMGAPRPTFTWQHNGNILDLQPGIFQEDDHYRLSLNGDLHIFNVNSNDRGRYTCSVQNSVGDAEDYSVLEIIEGATFSQRPGEDDVELNLTALMQCQASYPPERDMIYEWKFNDHVIDFKRETEYAMGSGSSEGYLYIGPAQFHNEGWYTCSIISAMDKQSASAYLTVLGPPGEPAGVNVRDKPFENMDPTEMEGINLDTTRWLTWMNGPTHGDPISHYFIQFRTNYDREWRVHPDGNNVPISRTMYEQFSDTKVLRLTNLKAGAGIDFRVLARNAFGVGTPSVPAATIQIPGAKPTQPVKNVRGGGGSVGDLTIVWDPVPLEDHNGLNFRYKVMWRTYESGVQSDTAQWRDEIISHEKACIHEFTLNSGLIFICRLVTTVGASKYYLPYQAQVIPVNHVGEGPPSNISVVMSAEEMPLGTPESVYAQVFNATALMVTWNPVKVTRNSMRGELKGYKINYWRMNTEEESDALQKPIELKPGQTNLDRGLIIGLEPTIWYSFNVQAYNHAGNGPKSSSYEQQTLNKVPGLYPTEVHVYSIEGKGIRVNFRGVSTRQREEPLVGYKVQIWKDSENIRSAVDYDVGKSNTGVIRNLTDGVIYQLRVFGYSRAGQGERSSPSVYFTVGGGEMRINLETTEIQSGVPSIVPSLIVTVFVLMFSISVLKSQLLS